MHDRFSDLLHQFQLDKNLIPVIKKQLEITWNNMMDSSANDSKSMIAKLSDLKGKLEKVKDRFATGEIDRAIYEKASSKLAAEISNFQKNSPNLILIYRTRQSSSRRVLYSPLN